MSVRMELDELVKWLSERLAKDEPAPPPESVSRENWKLIHANLEHASETLAKARAVLGAGAGSSFLAEFSGDLSREAEGLALRAQLLSRRADTEPEPKPEPKPEPEPEPEPEPDPKPKPADQHAAPAPARAAHAVAEQVVSHPPASKLVAKARGTIETAYAKLGAIEQLDAVSKAFEEELDVLAELTLSLHQKSLEEENRGEGADGG
ncbi:MAG: hypothetical protein ACJ757_03985 [Gaiellaceae bacterium]